FITGLLMAGFMAAALCSVLVGSILSEQAAGPKRVFFWGAVCAILGMGGHVFAGDVLSMFLLRMLTGLGYGFVYAAAQVHIARNVDPVHRTSGFSLFLAVVVAAEICGPAVGGIMADRFGEKPVLLTATMLIAGSAFLSLVLLPRFPPDILDPSAVPDATPTRTGSPTSPKSHGVRGQWTMIVALLTNPRFSVTTACFAIPAKVLLTGGLFMLVPLTVFANGGTVTESARVLMGYGIAILLLITLLARLADIWKRFSIWIATGGIAAGAGFVLPHAWNVFGGDGLTVLFVATLVFGFGQTLSIPTQISFVLQIAEKQVVTCGAGSVLGVFRFLERLGSCAGPIIAGVLLLAWPPDVALMWMGFGAILLAALGLSWFMAVGQYDDEEEIRALFVQA
ncbi:MAG: MFS transporter, partial [Rhodobacteraceae bacterium]|nr:MFS transporter [Paracoccaceae bacterium]